MNWVPAGVGSDASRVRLASAVGVSACLVQRNFQRRKVAIGDCGRSYDTPCIHEHSCLRCPLLRPDPAAKARLEEIRNNLIARIAEAESHHWYGEAEGLKVSLAGANAKLAQMDQISASRTKTVQLGIPSFTDTARRTTDPQTQQNQL